FLADERICDASWGRFGHRFLPGSGGVFDDLTGGLYLPGHQRHQVRPSFHLFWGSQLRHSPVVEPLPNKTIPMLNGKATQVRLRYLAKTIV
ncbi:MAG: hypothetical protein WA902_09195, partial [Thermosynechococcaceae cyanobacterium]